MMDIVVSLLIILLGTGGILSYIFHYRLLISINAGLIIINIASELGQGGGGAKHFALGTFKDDKLLMKSIEIGNNIINQLCENYNE